MKKDSFNKKLLIGIVSLALICPLVLGSISNVNNIDANASVRTEKVAKHHKKVSHHKINKKAYHHISRKHKKSNKKHVKHQIVRHRHKLYKGIAKNKRAYINYKRAISKFYKTNRKIYRKLNINKRSKAFKRGVHDALYNTFSNKLKKNKQYRYGLEAGTKENDAVVGIKDSKKQLNSIFNTLSNRNTPHTGSALSQMKNEARIGTILR